MTLVGVASTETNPHTARGAHEDQHGFEAHSMTSELHLCNECGNVSLVCKNRKSGLAHDTEVWFLDSDSVVVAFSHRPCIAYHCLLITHLGLPLWHKPAVAPNHRPSNGSVRVNPPLPIAQGCSRRKPILYEHAESQRI